MPAKKETKAENVETTPEIIISLEKAAKEYVKRAMGVEIEKNEDSLAFVDQYIQDIRKQDLPKPEILLLVASALGAHLGQTILNKIEGRWYGPLYEDSKEKQKNEENSLESLDVNLWRIEISSPPLSCAPMAMAMAALLQEDNEDLDTRVTTTQELTPPLEEALSRLNPVTEDYYYSLTGRYETMLYMLEILAKLHKNES